MKRLLDRAGERVLCIAHRGARCFAPENTLVAFEKAIAIRCHMIELDVHLTRDDRLVVHHDDDLLRCTDVRHRFPLSTSHFVSAMSLSEIQSLDAGTWFVRELERDAAGRQPFLRSLTPSEQAAHVSAEDRSRFCSGHIVIPTLEAVLARIEPTPTLINIEIKSLPRMYRSITPKVLECVHRFGMASRTLISSFDHRQLVEVRAADSQIATGVLSSDRLAAVPEYLRLLDADAYHPGCSDEFDSLGFASVAGHLDRDVLDRAVQAGVCMNAWTCNQPSQMEALLDAGITGIITDYPHRLLSLLAAGTKPA